MHSTRVSQPEMRDQSWIEPSSVDQHPIAVCRQKMFNIFNNRTKIQPLIVQSVDHYIKITQFSDQVR